MEPTKYTLTHDSGEYYINISIDIEELKRRVRAGIEILTLFDSNNNQITKPISFLDECDIKIAVIKNK